MIVVVVGCLSLVIVAVLWFANTEALDFPYQDEAIQLTPGESAEVEIDGCLPNIGIRYRPSAFGRWQETHVNGQRDIRRWWDISSRSYDHTLACRSGPWVVSIPDDLVSDHFAICGSGNDCVEIIVDRAD